MAKSTGRKKADNFSYEEAAEIVQGLRIQSRSEYVKWHREFDPDRLPRYPHRTYIKEWTSWNDFLGNDNKFRGERCARPKREDVKNVGQ